MIFQGVLASHNQRKMEVYNKQEHLGSTIISRGGCSVCDLPVEVGDCVRVDQLVRDLALGDDACALLATHSDRGQTTLVNSLQRIF